MSAGARLRVLWSLQGRQLWRVTSRACCYPEPELSEDALRGSRKPAWRKHLVITFLK